LYHQIVFISCDLQNSNHAMETVKEYLFSFIKYLNVELFEKKNNYLFIQNLCFITNGVVVILYAFNFLLCKKIYYILVGSKIVLLIHHQ
jgi:hypothetical protein